MEHSRKRDDDYELAKAFSGVLAARMPLHFLPTTHRHFHHCPGLPQASLRTGPLTALSERLLGSGHNQSEFSKETLHD